VDPIAPSAAGLGTASMPGAFPPGGHYAFGAAPAPGNTEYLAYLAHQQFLLTQQQMAAAAAARGAVPVTNPTKINVAGGKGGAGGVGHPTKAATASGAGAADDRVFHDLGDLRRPGMFDESSIADTTATGDMRFASGAGAAAATMRDYSKTKPPRTVTGDDLAVDSGDESEETTASGGIKPAAAKAAAKKPAKKKVVKKAAKKPAKKKK
jgi:hypothetical protein